MVLLHALSIYLISILSLYIVFILQIQLSTYLTEDRKFKVSLQHVSYLQFRIPLVLVFDKANHGHELPLNLKSLSSLRNPNCQIKITHESKKIIHVYCIILLSPQFYLSVYLLILSVCVHIAVC